MAADLRPKRDDEMEQLSKKLDDLEFICKVGYILVIIVFLFLAFNCITGTFMMDPFLHGPLVK